MTYLHSPLRDSYCRRWRVLRFCSEWEKVVPRRTNDRERCAFFCALKSKEKEY